VNIEALKVAFRSIVRAPVNEVDLHETLSLCLDRAGILHEREVETATGPVDFVIEGVCAMEVKVAGSGLVVARQLARYLNDERYACGVIVTTKAMQVPVEKINGKPIQVIELWRQFT